MTTTITKTDVVTAVTSFVADNNRPCPAKFLAEKFGTDVLDVIDELKGAGILLGLRGRNGGLALPGTAIVAKRSEYAAKKAAKTTAAPVEAEPLASTESNSEAVESVNSPA